MIFLVYFLFLEEHFFERKKNHFHKPVFLSLYLSTICCFYLRVTVQFLEILGAVHLHLTEGNMSHLLLCILFLLHTSSFAASVFILKKIIIQGSNMQFPHGSDPQHPKTNKFKLFLNVQHLSSAYLCYYFLLRSSSSGCFSASDIFVLWHFLFLVISRVPKHCPVQHLFKYQFLGRF